MVDVSKPQFTKQAKHFRYACYQGRPHACTRMRPITSNTKRRLSTFFWRTREILNLH